MWIVHEEFLFLGTVCGCATVFLHGLPRVEAPSSQREVLVAVIELFSHFCLLRVIGFAAERLRGEVSEVDDGAAGGGAASGRKGSAVNAMALGVTLVYHIASGLSHGRAFRGAMVWCECALFSS